MRLHTTTLFWIAKVILSILTQLIGVVLGDKFPYRIRQAAGDSALGNYKFNMPSSDAIYLHDTPNHSLFSKKDRALSSGCVRVEKSDQLASILLQEAGWSEDKKRNVLESKKTTSASIRTNDPVFLYYVTAWVENGQTQSFTGYL